MGMVLVGPSYRTLEALGKYRTKDGTQRSVKTLGHLDEVFPLFLLTKSSLGPACSTGARCHT